MLNEKWAAAAVFAIAVSPSFAHDSEGFRRQYNPDPPGSLAVHQLPRSLSEPELDFLFIFFIVINQFVFAICTYTHACVFNHGDDEIDVLKAPQGKTALTHQLLLDILIVNLGSGDPRNSTREEPVSDASAT